MDNLIMYYQLIIDKLSAITKDILVEYRFLSSLEKIEQKNSIQYKLSYNYLNDLLNQEQEIYDKIKGNGKLLNSLLVAIMQYGERKSDFIIPKDDLTLISTRIALKLSQYLTDLNEVKSIEIFSVLNKMDFYSVIHYETLWQALFLYQDFLEKYPNPILEENLIECKYTYSFMFPYLDEYIGSNSFNLEEIPTKSEILKEKTNVTSEDIINFKTRKFKQVRNYLRNYISSEYLLLIFYLNVLNSSLESNYFKEIDLAIKRSRLNKENKTELKEFCKG